MNSKLRSVENENKYEELIKNRYGLSRCAICDEVSLKDFKFWRIINNAFPYDLIASKHHMLIPKRHVVEDGLGKEELEELREIKKSYVNGHYDIIMESAEKDKSIPDHFHLHLVVLK